MRRVIEPKKILFLGSIPVVNQPRKKCTRDLKRSRKWWPERDCARRERARTSARSDDGPQGEAQDATNH